MFERFEDRARRAVVLAHDEARMLRHDYVGTEHVLLGLLHEGGLAAAVLEELGLSLASARSLVEQSAGRSHRPPSGHIPLTPRARRVLDLSVDEARALGHDSIGTEHLLLAVLVEGEGLGAQILAMFDIDLGLVRDVVVALSAPQAGAPRAEDAEAGLPDPVVELSAVELTLARLSLDHDQREVAAGLSLPVQTVERTLRRIYAKLHIATREQLAALLAAP